ncbi:hypothetical protein BN59_01556 [Legionella massiliensis]|uniref:Uncharacterized protein n=1 Tax=Legionella massiliensis TaxID=1034943 RepID=A0A078KZP6_9GAMM|nr:hypothetical protein [Legionella massiliensis]CDZ77274.1 hypothetical protein BN59_01556 [Legionella massiliensis]CEE13012.1 hypothetical protein BN1094_01556 [Legionella massiliensis]
MNIDEFNKQFAEITNLTLDEVTSDGVEKIVFEHAKRLNPELNNLDFKIDGQAVYSVENDNLVISYKSLNNREDFAKIANAYNDYYEGIQVDLTDWEDRKKNNPNFYFALVINVNVFLKKALPDFVEQRIPNNKLANTYKAVLADIRAPSILSKQGFRKNPYRGGYVYPQGLSLYPSAVVKIQKSQEDVKSPSASESQKIQLRKLITKICTNHDYWSDKIRCGSRFPDGISQIIDISNDYQLDQALQLIGQTADYKYSPYFQFAHSFFRGRDSKTNELYGILAKLNQGVDSRTVSTVIGDLERQFPTEESANEKSNLLDLS